MYVICAIAMFEVLQDPPADGGLWSGPKVAQGMSELLGREVAPQRGWEYLRILEYVRRRPHPAHSSSDLLVGRDQIELRSVYPIVTSSQLTKGVWA
jgi:hypothetical protein